MGSFSYNNRLSPTFENMTRTTSPLLEDGGIPTSRQILDQLTGLVDATEDEIIYKPSTSTSKFPTGQNFQSNYNILNNSNQTGTSFRATVDCRSAYTWPPSTTVAGRHLRDKHPEVYYKAMSEENSRKRSETLMNSNRNTNYNSARKRTYPVNNKNDQFFNNLMDDSFSASLAASFASIHENDRLSNSNSSFNHKAKLIKIEKPDEKSPSPDLISMEPGFSSSSNSLLSNLLNRSYSKDVSNTEKDNITNSNNIDSNNEKNVQLKTEIARLKEQEHVLKIKFQKSNENFLDAQTELENLRSRNEQLEKKQKKEQLTIILEQKEKLEKQCFDQNIALSKKNTEILNLKEEKSEVQGTLNRTRRDLDETNESRNNNALEEDAVSLKRKNRELIAKENELDDVLSKNELMQQNITRLEMSSERLRTDSQRETDLKENEINDIRAQYQRRREKLPKQNLIRQLKEQLEDAEANKLAALKGRFALESELADLRQQLDSALTAKNVAEEKISIITRDKNSTQSLAQEHDEQLQDLQKKYKILLQQANVDAIQLADQVEQIANLERAKQRLQEQLNEMAASVEYNKMHTVEKHKIQLLELKFRDIQAKLDLEISVKLRLESIVAKLREEVELLQSQILDAKSAKEKESEISRKNKREIQILQEQISELKKRETELLQRGKNTKNEYENLNDKYQSTLTELKNALRRADDLQAVLKEDVIIEEEEDDEIIAEDGNSDIMGVGRSLTRNSDENSHTRLNSRRSSTILSVGAEETTDETTIKLNGINNKSNRCEIAQ